MTSWKIEVTYEGCIGMTGYKMKGVVFAKTRQEALNVLKTRADKVGLETVLQPNHLFITSLRIPLRIDVTGADSEVEVYEFENLRLLVGEKSAAAS